MKKSEMEVEIQELKRLLKDAVLVIEDFLPNIGRCALQNYERLNTVLCESRKYTHAVDSDE